MSLRQGLSSFSARRRRTVSREMLSCSVSPDQFTRQEFQRPARATFGRVRTGRCDQQGLLFAGELAVGSRAWLFAERGLQVADHEAALGPIDG
jgi:hypothetical protein